MKLQSCIRKMADGCLNNASACEFTDKKINRLSKSNGNTLLSEQKMRAVVTNAKQLQKVKDLCMLCFDLYRGNQSKYPFFGLCFEEALTCSFQQALNSKITVLLLRSLKKIRIGIEHLGNKYTPERLKWPGNKKHEQTLRYFQAKLKPKTFCCYGTYGPYLLL